MRRKREGGSAGLSPWKKLLDHIMTVVGFVSPLALVPQVLDVWTTHDVTGFSLLTWMMLSVFNVLWALYGYVHKVYPVMVSSAAFAVLQVAIILAILTFS